MIINEVSGEHYTGKEQMIFSPNEHFLNQQDGNEEERISDRSEEHTSELQSPY